MSHKNAVKRTIILLLVLTMLSALAACGNVTETDTSPDSDRTFSTQSTAQMCEIGDTVYYVTTDITAEGSVHLIYYYEKASGVSGPLCGKPECRHTDAKCNAYAGNVVAIGSYNGMIYYFGYEYGAGNVICRMAADGTEHKTVRTLKQDTFPSSGYGRIIQFHRGYMYYATETTTMVDGQQCDGLYIAAVPLDSDGEITVILNEESGDVDLSAQLYGDSMYIMDCGEKLRLRRWDCKTHDMELLLYTESPIGSPEFWVADRYIYFNGATGKVVSEDGIEGTARDVYRYGLSDGVFEFAFSWLTPIGYSAIITDEMIAAVSWPVDEKVYAVAVDFQGNTILDASFSVADFPDIVLRGVCQGADEDYVYLYTLGSGGFAVPLDGGEPILLYTLDQ